MASFFIKIVVHGQGQQLHLKQTPSQLCHCQFCEIFMERQFYRANVSGCFSLKKQHEIHLLTLQISLCIDKTTRIILLENKHT